MVDEWVSVFLLAIYHLVAVDLFLAHRILAVPFEQHIQRPVGENGETVLCKHVGLPCGNAVVVACRHVEVAACEVALILVVGFEYSS